MSFRLEPKVTTAELWRLSMRRIYRSLVGKCNLILAGVILVMTYRFWGEMSSFLRGIMLFLCILFPVMQPVSVWLQVEKQVKLLPKDFILEIDDSGLHITGDKQKAHIQWNQVRGVIQEKDMLILTLEGGRGLNRNLGQRWQALTIRKKIATFTVVDVNRILEDNAQSIQLVRALEAGNEDYRRTMPKLLSIPWLVFAFACVVVAVMFRLSRLMNKTIISPVMKLVTAAKVLEKGVQEIVLTAEEKEQFQSRMSDIYEKYCSEYMDIIDSIIEEGKK